MSDNEPDIDDLQRRMDGALEALRKEFSGLRTGRASASLLEPIMVEAYGATVPINQLGNINVPEPRMISVQVWDKANVKAVEKAIRNCQSRASTRRSTARSCAFRLPELSRDGRCMSPSSWTATAGGPWRAACRAAKGTAAAWRRCARRSRPRSTSACRT
jgi:ribosome recycling factor